MEFIFMEEEEEEQDIQLAENANVEIEEPISTEYNEKRYLLEKTKITKQTWSIVEIFQKIKEKKLIVDTNYQRNVIWNPDKKTSFIESLFMEIIIPPIYVVEIPGDDFLSENKYEVVDGKQRLSTIDEFLRNSLSLNEKSLEYYRDLYGGKNFFEIKECDSEKISRMLSYVLDVYVITANSPESTKYDIFARLNKGAEKLKVNEIRRAIYHSEASSIITEFVNSHISESASPDLKKQYESVFSKNDIKRFFDFGRFYRSLAFYIQSDLTTNTVKNYNSRPREMINYVLQGLQEGKITIEALKVREILQKTLDLKSKIESKSNDYIIDSFIPFAVDYWDKLICIKDKIIKEEGFQKTLEKSPATTSNVNKRLEILSKFIKDDVI